jgi:hypothetical protein
VFPWPGTNVPRNFQEISTQSGIFCGANLALCAAMSLRTGQCSAGPQIAIKESLRRVAVLGWLILFASIAGLGAITLVTGNALSTSERMATALFLVLFIIGLLTRVARGRAW